MTRVQMRRAIVGAFVVVSVLLISGTENILAQPPGGSVRKRSLCLSQTCHNSSHDSREGCCAYQRTRSQGSRFYSD